MGYGCIGFGSAAELGGWPHQRRPRRLHIDDRQGTRGTIDLDADAIAGGQDAACEHGHELGSRQRHRVELNASGDGRHSASDICRVAVFEPRVLERHWPQPQVGAGYLRRADLNVGLADPHDPTRGNSQRSKQDGIGLGSGVGALAEREAHSRTVMAQWLTGVRSIGA